MQFSEYSISTGGLETNTKALKMFYSLQKKKNIKRQSLNFDCHLDSNCTTKDGFRQTDDVPGC